MKHYPIARLFLLGAALMACYGLALSFAKQNATLDIHLHDTYFVIAYAHIITVAVLLLVLFAGAYYLFSKLSGKPVYRIPGAIHFWCTFIGMLLIFMPVHYESVAGMPRRYYDYSAWESFRQFVSFNSLASAVIIIVALSQVIFPVNIIASLFRKRII